jgi:hypothetical protein
MNGAVVTFSARRELAYRVSGGLEVVLYWSAGEIGTSIEIRQPATGETLSFAVPPERALDAFYHPFVYLPVVAGRPEPVAA